MYTDENIKGKQFDLDTTIQMLSAAPHSKYPLWINISMIENHEKNVLFDVEISLRFRLPKTLSNQETDYPPTSIQFLHHYFPQFCFYTSRSRYCCRR